MPRGWWVDPKLSRNNKIDRDYRESFIEGYLECALLSSTDTRDPDGNGPPLDENYSVDDLAPDAVRAMRADCIDFMIRCWTLLQQSDLAASRAGYDFWLTRNRHGTGFWDEGLDELGQELTEAAHSEGESDLYVGDDERIHIM
jgi:hypothetical protein